jgi:uncharacterized protein involved in exopolysaccharide biosynthesis
VNVRQALHILWLRRWLTVLTVVTAMSAATLVGLVFPPRYVAKSRVMLAIFKPDPITGGYQTAKTLPAYVATQADLVRDYRVTGLVVDNLGWTSSPELLAAYDRRDPSDTRDFRRWLAQRIADNTGIGLAPDTNIMEISFSSGDPEQAARLADAVRDAYVQQDLATRRDEAASTADWLTRQAARLRVDLAAAEKRKSDFERANGIVLARNGDDPELYRMENQLRAPPPPPAKQRAQGSSELAIRLQAADAALAGAERVLGANNPELAALRRQREVLASAAARQQTERTTPLAPVRATYDALTLQILARKGKTGEAQQLSSDVATIREQYDATVKRMYDLQQKSQVDESELKPLGNAPVETEPVSPNWPFLLLGSAGLGFLLGCVVSLLAELLGQRVRGTDDLVFPDVPLLGVAAGPPVRRRRLAWLRRLIVPWRLRRAAAAD